MKRKDYRKALSNLFSRKDRNLLQEMLENKPQRKEVENMDYQNRVCLLKSEVNKKWKELVLYYQNELQKIQIQHNQKMKSIDLQ